MTRNQRIQAYIKRTVPPSQWNARTIRTQRLIAEQAIDRAENGGVLNLISFVGDAGEDGK